MVSVAASPCSGPSPTPSPRNAFASSFSRRSRSTNRPSNDRSRSPRRGAARALRYPYVGRCALSSDLPYARAWYSVFGGIMNAPRHGGTDPILCTVAWLYVTPWPRSVFLLATLSLAAFLVLVQIALVLLRRLGA